VKRLAVAKQLTNCFAIVNCFTITFCTNQLKGTANASYSYMKCVRVCAAMCVRVLYLSFNPFHVYPLQAAKRNRVKRKTFTVGRRSPSGLLSRQAFLAHLSKDKNSRDTNKGSDKDWNRNTNREEKTIAILVLPYVATFNCIVSIGLRKCSSLCKHWRRKEDDAIESTKHTFRESKSPHR